jgi:hypothetical protein
VIDAIDESNSIKTFIVKTITILGGVFSSQQYQIDRAQCFVVYVQYEKDDCLRKQNFFYLSSFLTRENECGRGTSFSSTILNST